MQYTINADIVSVLGLGPVAEALENCTFSVEYAEAPDGSEILRSGPDSPVHLEMALGQAMNFHLTGTIEADQEAATEHVRSFSDCLGKKKIVHTIEILEGEAVLERFHYGWPR